MCNVPADGACDKGDLALAIGCVPEYGALAPVQPLDADVNTPQGAEWQPGQAPMPVIEFGLQRAGYVSVQHTLAVPPTMCPVPSAGVGGSGAWTVHASSATQTSRHESAAKTVHALLMQAIANQATSRGYFHQPFMVRYAVRMTDGSYVAVSPPVAMLPSALPPCFAVASIRTADDDECLITLGSTSAYYCRLRCRVVRGLDTDVSAGVAGVDIFCTPQMLTYRADMPSDAGVVGYAAMVTDAAGRSGAAVRDEMLAGHWAEGGDAAADHCLADMPWADSRCWGLLRDASWESRLLAADGFYRVASIPASALVASDGFVDVHVCDAGEAALKKLPRLPVNAANDVAVAPDAVLAQGDRMIVGGSTRGTAAVWPLRSMVPYAAGTEEGSVRLSVLAKGPEGEYTVSTECSGACVGARYLYTDIPGAYAIAIATDAGCLMMRLAPHASLPGAYWWGGAQSEVLGVSRVLSSSLPAGAGSVRGTARIEVRSVSNPWHAVSVWDLPSERVLALAQSLRAMSAGQFGQFGLYVFTDTGLWALPDAGGSPVMVTTDTCVSAGAVAAVEDGIAFVSRRGVHLVNGSNTRLISGDLSGAAALGLNELPGLGSLLAIAGTALPAPLYSCLDQAVLAYDKQRCRLYVSGGGEADFVYSLQSGKWGMCAARPVGSGVPLAVVTRPMTFGGKRLSRVCAVGRLDAAASAICVYGSHNLASWHVVASSRGTATDIITGTEYAYYVVAFVTRYHVSTGGPCVSIHMESPR